MQTLLMAECAEEICNCVKHSLGGEFEFHTCHDGETALERLQELQPDILLLNLMLPFKDGLTLLQETPYKPPVILAWSYFIEAHIVDRAIELGVGDLLNTPTTQTIVVRLMDLLGNRTEEKGPAKQQARIALQLHLLRFASHLDGYQQLCVGLQLYRRDSQQNLCKELYPAIAEACGSKTAKCVEHSIRNAIEAAWNSGSPGVWERFFPNVDRCPTNKAFIARMSELLDDE